MKKIKKKEWILPLVLLIILLFSACNNGEKTKTENVELVNNKNTIIDGVKYNDAELTPEEAFDKFIDLHSKAKIKEVKLETKNDILEYKIEGYDSINEYQFRLDAKSGDVSSNVKNLDEDNKDKGIITRDDIGKISDIVNKSFEETDKDYKFKKWSLEEEDGILEFEIEFKDKDNKEIEYTYDLKTGDLKKKKD